MKLIRLKCSCGKIIDYTFDVEIIETKFEERPIIPILVPHEDHFVTAYIDENYDVRSVESLILVNNDQSSVVVKSPSIENEIMKKINDLIKKKDPLKEFYPFLALIISEIKKPEYLFIAGRIIGSFLWNNRREPIIKLGAAFKIEPKLLIKNEIAPIYEKIIKVENLSSDETKIVLNDVISPQFIVGVAQGILNAIHEYMNKNVDLALEYKMRENSVILNLKEAGRSKNTYEMINL